MGNIEKANWEKWQFIPEVILWEAVALSLDIEPEYLDAKDPKISRHKQAIQYEEEKEFNDRYFIAESNMGKNKALLPLSVIPRGHRHGISLVDFSAWAQSLNWEIPQELANLATQNVGQNKSTTNFNSCFYLDTKWEDMTWTLISNDAVKIEVKGISKRYNYSDLKFKDERMGDIPTSRWVMLRKFAEMNGEISWGANITENQKDTLKGAVRDINKKLKEVFNIDVSPISYDRKTSSYKTLFTFKDAREKGDTVDSEPKYFSEEAIKQFMEEDADEKAQLKNGVTNTKYDENQ